MAKVSKYGVLFYSGEAGYLNNRAQIQLSDAEGNTLAFVRFKDPRMPYELEGDRRHHHHASAVSDVSEHSRCRPQ